MGKYSAHEIIAVHEELAALVKAGMPLPSNLRILARELPRTLRPAVEQLAALLEQGTSVDAALQATGLQANAQYATYFGTLLQTKHPAQALEHTAFSARKSLDFRSYLMSEMIYPFIVLQVATGLIYFSKHKLVPVYAKMGSEFEIPMSKISLLISLLDLTDVVFLICLLVSCYCLYAASVSSLNPKWVIWPFAKIRKNAAESAFCRMLGSLIENQVPLEKALILTANVTTWHPLQQAAMKLAGQLQRGEKITKAMTPISPYVTWLLQSTSGAAAAQELRREADRAQRTVEQQQRWIRLYIPMFMTLVIGFFSLMCMAIMNFYPLIIFINRISELNK
jgi:general secretion pathway protein F